MLRLLIPNTISSNDPVLNILQTDPNSLFQKPFAGHIIFLFGELDEEIATWFSRAIISLDSLTGDDIACVIYAKKIRITIDRNREQYSSFSFIEQRNSEGIVIDSINRNKDAEVLVRNGRSLWNSSTEETTAITYGADEIANAFKISDQLPCILFLDAILDRNEYQQKISELNKFIIPLQNFPAKDVMLLLRKIIQKFRDKEGYSAYLKDIHQLDALSKEFEIAHLKAVNFRKELTHREIERKVFLDKATNSIVKVQWSLFQGSKRYFIQELSRIPGLQQTTIDNLSTKMTADYQLLAKYSKCIETLKYYLSIENRIDDEEIQARIRKVFIAHVAPLIDEQHLFPAYFTSLDCNRALEELVNRQLIVLKSYLKSLPTSSEIEFIAKQKFGCDIDTLFQQLTISEKLEFDLRTSCENISSHCISPDHPSLIEVVRDILNPKNQKEEALLNSSNHKWDFFIAHAGSDNDIAEKLYKNLSSKAKVFLDSVCLKYGDDWDVELSEAQHNSKITIVLISSFTDRAYYQREEIAAAISMARNDKQKHRVVPIYLDVANSGMTNTPYGLRLKHSIVVSDRNLISSVTDKLLMLL